MYTYQLMHNDIIIDMAKNAISYHKSSLMHDFVKLFITQKVALSTLSVVTITSLSQRLLSTSLLSKMVPMACTILTNIEFACNANEQHHFMMTT
jgi:hypothetical protein